LAPPSSILRPVDRSENRTWSDGPIPYGDQVETKPFPEQCNMVKRWEEKSIVAEGTKVAGNSRLHIFSAEFGS
jgi:hypothetical protein